MSDDGLSKVVSWSLYACSREWATPSPYCYPSKSCHGIFFFPLQNLFVEILFAILLDYVFWMFCDLINFFGVLWIISKPFETHDAEQLAHAWFWLNLTVLFQVLFSEQLKLRNAITGSSFVRNYQPSDSPLKQEAMGGSQQVTLVSQSGHENSSTQMDIKALQQDVMFMKAKFMELHQDYSAVTQQVYK